MSCGIYKIVNRINGKVYIGQSISIEKRFIKHRNEGFNLNSEAYEYPLYRAIRKYGLKNFIFEIVEECSVEELDAKEKFYISEFDSTEKEKGYNISFGTISPVKLTPKSVSEIQGLLIQGELSQTAIAEKFGITQQMVSLIDRGESWREDSLEYPLKSNKLFCPCGNQITRYSSTGFCSKCVSEIQRVSERPSREELKILIRNNSFVSIGKQFGVSDNAIRKWCKAEGLPHRVTDIRKYSNEEWAAL